MSESTKNIIRAKGRPMLYREGKTASLETEYYPAQETEVYGDKQSPDFNKVFWGDNFQVLCNLMKEYRGKIGLIYIDPPFDSKADYVKKIKFRGQEIIGREQSLLEETQYSDIRGKDEYLQFMYERLLLLRELLSETGSIYLHCDHHKAHHLRCMMDEVFGEENFRNEIARRRQVPRGMKAHANFFPFSADYILIYSKNNNPVRNLIKKEEFISIDEAEKKYMKDEKGYFRTSDVGSYSNESLVKFFNEGKIYVSNGGEAYIDEKGFLKSTKGSVAVKYHRSIIGNKVLEEKVIDNIWDDIPGMGIISSEFIGYPTQKPEALLERIIKASSNPGDIVLDCFMGSGTTCAVAQKLGRKRIGCDINTGAINTTIKRLNQIIQNQEIEVKTGKETGNDIKAPLAFKVYNVNEYNLFKNKEEGVDTYKQIIMESYGVSTKRGYRDGETSSALVKIIDPNRILSKKDIDDIIKNTDDTSDDLIYSKSPLKYKDIQIICSGKELDSDDYVVRIKKEGKLNKDIDIQIKDLLIEKEGLLFKEKPYIEYQLEKTSKETSENLILSITDFISPVLLKKLDIENKGKSDKIVIEDRKQSVDSIAIDIDYDGALFNAEIIDSPSKKELVQGVYDLGKIQEGVIAIKVIDILGEELFLTIDAMDEKQ